METQTMARNMMTSLIAVKRQACVDHRGPWDLAMMLDIRMADEPGRIAVIRDRDDMETTVRHIVKPGERVSHVGLVADAYVQSAEWQAGQPTPPVPQRGEIQEAFHAGNLAVEEELVVQVIDVRTDELVALAARYRYCDSGLPHFDQPEVWDRGVIDGQVPDNLKAIAARLRGAW